jgi:FdhD protein
VGASGARVGEDRVAVEEPLEIRVETGDGAFPLAVTMRTPGDDLELAAGFLFGEGIVHGAEDIVSLRHCREVPAERRQNTVTARLAAEPAAAAAALSRRFTVSSACGVCGLDSLDALETRGLTPVRSTPVERDVLLALPDRLRDAQPTFDRTGGLHAAGLFSPSGDLLCAREDVGRHNALDKVIGWALMQGVLPVTGHAIVVSGRTSYELAVKAIAAGAGVLAGVSAPSSLAVQTARRFGLSLAGFVRESRLVLYAGDLVDEAVPAGARRAASSPAPGS